MNKFLLLNVSSLALFASLLGADADDYFECKTQDQIVEESITEAYQDIVLKRYSYVEYEVHKANESLQDNVYQSWLRTVMQKNKIMKALPFEELGKKAIASLDDVELLKNKELFSGVSYTEDRNKIYNEFNNYVLLNFLIPIDCIVCNRKNQQYNRFAPQMKSTLEKHFVDGMNA